GGSEADVHALVRYLPMKQHLGILVLMYVVAVGGCASSKNGSDTGEAPPSGAAPSSARQMSNAAGTTAADPNAGPNIPKGAQWTLYCLTIGGDTHVAQANRLKADLLKTTTLRDWYVIHQDNESILCYGY